jgi:hypothetical protein
MVSVERRSSLEGINLTFRLLIIAELLTLLPQKLSLK